MFDLLKESFIDLGTQTLLHLYHSLNQPQISPGVSKKVQAAEAYMMVLQASSTKATVYIGLYFNDDEQRVLYSSGLFSMDQLEHQISQAESFLGEMGFMMDNLYYSKASSAERTDLIRPVPFFYKDKELYYQALSQSEIEVKRSSRGAPVVEAVGDSHQRGFWEQYAKMLSML